jgi:TolB-like protein/Flp pilus assembly protein TadD
MRIVSLVLIATTFLARPVLAQCADGSPPPCRTSARAITAPANSIAVLYFDNLSRDTADTYLADGFSEEVMSRLGQVERLQVKSRTAVRRLRGSEADPTVAGRALAVSHLVSGSVLRQRGRLRVTVELTRVAGGNSVWTRSFERSADDIIAVEAEIAESVAVGVGARLLPAERQRIEARPTRNAAAYDHLLRGRFEQNRRTPESLRRAIREYDAALALDSLFVPALVGKATSLFGLGSNYYDGVGGESRTSLMERGHELADRALRIDSMSADAWVAAGMDRRSVTMAGRAVALDPRNAEAHHSYAMALRATGKDSLAILEFQRALAVDPDRPISLLNMGQVFVLNRRYEEGQRWLDSAVALGPEPSFYYGEQAMVRLLRGDTAGARAAAAQVVAHGDRSGADRILAVIEARSGDTVAARRRLATADSGIATRDCRVSHDCLELAGSLAQIGERARALTVIERLTPVGDWTALWLRRPELDVIRNEPRFQRIIAASRNP